MDIGTRTRLEAVITHAQMEIARRRLALHQIATGALPPAQARRAVSLAAGAAEAIEQAQREIQVARLRIELNRDVRVPSDITDEIMRYIDRRYQEPVYRYRELVDRYDAEVAAAMAADDFSIYPTWQLPAPPPQYRDRSTY